MSYRDKASEEVLAFCLTQPSPVTFLKGLKEKKTQLI